MNKEKALRKPLLPLFSNLIFDKKMKVLQGFLWFCAQIAVVFSIRITRFCKVFAKRRSVMV